MTENLPSKNLPATRTTVAIADTNPIVRAALSEIINRDGRFEVLWSVGLGTDFLTRLDHDPVDIGFVNWSLPDASGADVLGELRQRQSAVRTIIYSHETSVTVLRNALRLGARAVVWTTDDPGDVLDTLASVARGKLSVPYLDIWDKDPLDELTARERDLLGALANGLSNEQIAARFGITRNTVKYHLKNLYDKLAVRTRTAAVMLLFSDRKDQNSR